MTHVHTNITMSLDSKVDGKKIANMSIDEMTGFLKRIGNENTDVVITDAKGQEVAGYDSESGMAYFRMTVARAFITALGL